MRTMLKVESGAMLCLLLVEMSSGFSPLAGMTWRSASLQHAQAGRRSAGLRLRTGPKMDMGDSSVASDADIRAKHAPNAMDFDTLGDHPWGSIEPDFMFLAQCKDGKWDQGGVQPWGDISISPKAGVLNYGQGLFEGMKAQRTEDGRIVIFRPKRNARRIAYGCERLLIPPIPEDLYVRAVEEGVLANANWIPPHGMGSMYVRAVVLGTGPTLGLSSAPSFHFIIYFSPVGSYFKGEQLTPIKLKIEDRYARAAKGGVGGVKAIGNYAASLMPQKLAKEEGFDNVIFLDAAEAKYIEEAGTSNIFIVEGNKIVTPPIQGNGMPEDTILEGVTRESCMQIGKDAGYEVIEERITYERLLAADEAFVVGTASGVCPVGKVAIQGKEKVWEFESGAGPATFKVYETLAGIQNGKVEDPYGWTVYLD